MIDPTYMALMSNGIAWIAKTDDLINRFPISIGSGSTVVELLQLVKSCTFPIMYLPVVDELNNAVGIINFVHLIKGEI